MKAAYIEQVGPPQTIQYGDLAMPPVGRKEILVKVEAVAVNGVDTYIRSGRVKTALPFPFIIGRDIGVDPEKIDLPHFPCSTIRLIYREAHARGQRVDFGF
jgi:hypothetical protein